MKALRLLAAAALAATAFCANAMGHLAQVSLFDRSSGSTLPVYWHEGRAYVVGRPGNEYQVMVRNDAGEDLLAVVSVDGVDVMSGETAGTHQGGYVIAAGDRADIRGWRKSLAQTAAFYFTSIGDSYAARTGRAANVGVIGVALFKRRPLPEPVPYADASPWRDEASQKRRAESPASQAPGAGAAESNAHAPGALYANPAAPLGTGHGRREDSPVRLVSFDRSTRDPVEILAIHYDSYRNLVARGVLPSLPAPREPQPFPAFVPDPPPAMRF